MRVTERVAGQVVILAFNGQLVFKERKIYQQALRAAKEKSPKKIVLNFQEVTYMDSAGLGLLALTSEQVKLENIDICLVSPGGVMKRILELTQLHKMIPLFENESEALNLGSSTLAPTS